MRYRWQFWHGGVRGEATLHLEKKPPKMERFSIGEKEAKEAKALRAKIEAVPGVCDCSSWNYEIRLTKAEVYGWGEITPAVLEIVREFFGEAEMSDLGDMQGRRESGSGCC